jgi:hypothetical protein
MSRIIATIRDGQGGVIAHAFTEGNQNQANLILRDGTDHAAAAQRAVASIAPGAVLVSTAVQADKTRFVFAAA